MRNTHDIDAVGIEIRQLRQAVAIASAGSFSAAADRLGISQPALSRSIQRLESDVGGPVFVRGKSGARPTPLGIRLLARASVILAELSDLVVEAAPLALVDARPLRIGVGPTMRGQTLPRALRTLRLRLGPVPVRLALSPEATLLTALIAGELDLVLGERIALEGGPGVELTSLREDPLIWAVRADHELATRRGELIPLRDLDGHLVAAPDLSFQALPGITTRGGDRLPFGLATLECNDAHLLISLVRFGDAVGLLPRSVVSQELQRGWLTLLDVRPSLSPSRPAVAWASRRKRSEAAEFLVQALPKRGSRADAVEDGES